MAAGLGEVVSGDSGPEFIGEFRFPAQPVQTVDHQIDLSWPIRELDTKVSRLTATIGRTALHNEPLR